MYSNFTKEQLELLARRANKKTAAQKLALSVGRVVRNAVFAIQRKVYRALMATPLNRVVRFPAMKIASLLLTDIILFAAFFAIAGTPMLLSGISFPASLGICAAIWLLMDAAACLIRKRAIASNSREDV